MPANSLITVDPEILGGTPVFVGTRVPVKTLFEYLEDNYSLDEFIECFQRSAARWRTGYWSNRKTRCFSLREDIARRMRSVAAS
jgi:Protein of unknown function (DUF433)